MNGEDNYSSQRSSDYVEAERYEDLHGQFMFAFNDERMDAEAFRKLSEQVHEAVDELVRLKMELHRRMAEGHGEEDTQT